MPTALKEKKEKPVEQKTFSLEIKTIDAAQGIIRGYLSVFNNVDYQKDRVRAGAFKKTIAEALNRKNNQGRKYLFPLLWMHDPNQPVGGVLEAEEDSKGLLITAQLDITTNRAGVPNNPLATSVFSGYLAGYVDELSMGYKAIQKEFTSDGVRDLKEVQLWEASCVTSLFAANNQAIVDDVKNIAEKNIAEKNIAEKDKNAEKDKKPSPMTTERKDFNDRYRAQRLDDWLYTDFYVLQSALRQSLIDMFMIGDSPQEDLDTTVLNGPQGFIQALRDWVQCGINLDAANYFNPDNNSISGMDYATWKNQSMDTKMDKKAGRAISAANADIINSHIKALSDAIMQHKAMSDMHTNTLEQVKNDMALLGTPENFEGETDEESKSKTTEPPSSTLSTQPDVTPSTEAKALADLEAYLRSHISHS